MAKTRSPTKKNSRGRRLTRLLVALPFAGAMILSGTLGARAFFLSPADFQHFLECFGYMLTDPQAHHDLCGPYTGPSDNSPLAGDSGVPGATATTTTTTVPSTTTTTVPPTTTTTVPTTVLPPTTTTTVVTTVAPS